MVERLENVLAMLEDRFGRRTTTGLLFLIGIAIAAYAIHIFLEHLIIPLYFFLRPFISGPEITIVTVFYVTAFIAAAIMLFPLGWLFLSRTTIPQAIVDQLAVLRSSSIHEILNCKVTNDTELTKFKTTQEMWRNNVMRILQNHFPKAEALGFERLGVIPQLAFPHSFNNEHAFELMMFAKRLSILEDIIRRYTH